MPSEREIFGAFLCGVLRETAFDIHRKIVERTPIDTGRAKASWNLAENVASEEVAPVLVDQINPIGGAIIRKAAPGAEALTAEQALAAALTQQQNIGPTAQVIVISNALTYIEKLENGSSRQAPAGMVTVTTTPSAVQAIVDAKVAQLMP